MYIQGETCSEDRGAMTKNYALKVARDLCYDDGVMEKLKKAKTENELLRILADARRNKEWYDDQT